MVRSSEIERILPARVFVTGASGLIGSALVPFLERQGYEVVRLVRRPPRGPFEVAWDPEGEAIDPATLEGFGAGIHLAGENLAAGRWTTRRTARIRESRVRGTRLLAEALAGLERPPRVLVSASAVGIYGDRDDEILTERSEIGRGFLAELASDWEAAAQPAPARGIRVVHPRTGLVLAPAGGALGRLMPIFRLGLGGPIGRGRAWWSWIALEDALAILAFALHREDLRGPVNLVAPGAVTNAEFTRTLARVLGRPAVLPVPPFGLRLLFGRMADEVLLTSQRVEPARLNEAGYRFRFPKLEAALRRNAGGAGKQEVLDPLRGGG